MKVLARRLRDNVLAASSFLAANGAPNAVNAFLPFSGLVGGGRTVQSNLPTPAV
jgi:hypothetical protein